MKKIISFICVVIFMGSLKAQVQNVQVNATNGNVVQPSGTTNFATGNLKVNGISVVGNGVGTVTWANVTGTPTSLNGYGVVNGSVGDLLLANLTASGNIKAPNIGNLTASSLLYGTSGGVLGYFTTSNASFLGFNSTGQLAQITLAGGTWSGNTYTSASSALGGTVTNFSVAAVPSWLTASVATSTVTPALTLTANSTTVAGFGITNGSKLDNLSGNLASSGNVPAANVVNGTLGNMTTTTPGAGVFDSALATRASILANAVASATLYYPSSSFTFVNSGSGSDAINPNGQFSLTSLETGGTTGSSSLAKVGVISTTPNFGRMSIINFGEPGILVIGAAYFTAPAAHTTVRFTLGKASGDGTGALVNVGVGFEVDNTTLVGVFFKSGSQSTVTLTGATLSANNTLLAVAWDGAGNLTWYVNGVAAGTSSSGPTSSTVSPPVVQAEIVNDTTGADIEILFSPFQVTQWSL